LHSLYLRLIGRVVKDNVNISADPFVAQRDQPCAWFMGSLGTGERSNFVWHGMWGWCFFFWLLVETKGWARRRINCPTMYRSVEFHELEQTGCEKGWCGIGEDVQMYKRL
jgi:hypothetical protein